MMNPKIVVVLLLLTLASGPALAGEAEDAAVINGCSDDIYSIRTREIYAPEMDNSMVNVNIENVLRGDGSKTGQFVDVYWDSGSSYPDMGDMWVIMVRPDEDGALHVHPRIRYDSSQETIYDVGKVQWIQQQVLPKAEARPTGEASAE